MPDIAMCTNKTCPSKNQCYRFKAVAKPIWQDYAMFEPNGSGRCEHYMALTEDRKEQIKKLKGNL